MFSKQVQFFGAGGQGMPTAEAGFGQRMRLIGSSIAAGNKGTVLQLGSSTSDPLLTEAISVGDGSPALTVELPNTKATFGIGSINFIYNSDDALAEDGFGLFIPAGFQVEARILVPDGGLRAGTPLMVDYDTTPGILIPAVATAGNVQKVVAYTSQDIADAAGGAAVEETAYVYFVG